MQIATNSLTPNRCLLLTGAGFERRADPDRQGFAFALARFQRRSELSRGDLKRIPRLPSASV